MLPTSFLQRGKQHFKLLALSLEDISSHSFCLPKELWQKDEAGYGSIVATAIVGHFKEDLRNI